MTDASALRPERWSEFDEMEVGVMQSALSLVIDGLIDPEAVAAMTTDEADAAAATIVLAGRLMYSISDHMQQARPSLSSLETVARSVALGSVPS